MAEEKPQESVYDRVRREARARLEQERQRRARLDELKERQDPGLLRRENTDDEVRKRFNR
jgi:hypothetical protein